MATHSFIHSSTHSFIQSISTAPLQVHYYSEALPTQHGHCAGISRRSATGNNCELRTCPQSVRFNYSGSPTHDPSDKRRHLYQCVTLAPQSQFLEVYMFIWFLLICYDNVVAD